MTPKSQEGDQCPRVIWMRKARTYKGLKIERVEADLITASSDYCTIEIAGERRAVKTEEIRLARAQSA
jgi:hypothetical protein